MSYPVAEVRAHFPALAEGAAHFDRPGGSQVPDVVGAAVATTLTAAIANRGTVTVAERRADRVVTDARASMADLLGADPGGIVFGRSMTALAYDLSRTLAKTWRPGDEIIVTKLDHDANIRPWVQAAAPAGVTVRWAEFDPATGELSADAVTGLVTERTRLVAVTAASNLLGSRPDTATIAERARAVYELLAGTTAAVDFLADLVPGDGDRRERLTTSMKALSEHEDRMRARLDAGLAKIDGVTLYGADDRRRTPTVLFTVAGVSNADVYAGLAESNVNAPAGTFYAAECAAHLGLDDTGAVRAGIGPYTDESDVDRLVAGVVRIAAYD